MGCDFGVLSYLIFYPFIKFALRDILTDILTDTLGAIQYDRLFTTLMNGDEYIDEVAFIVGFDRGEPFFCISSSSAASG